MWLYAIGLIFEIRILNSLLHILYRDIYNLCIVLSRLDGLEQVLSIDLVKHFISVQNRHFK